MEEVKVESDLRLVGVKKENVRQTIDKIKSQASDLLVFTLQWKDLEDYFNSAEAKIDKRFSEVKSKEMDLHNQTLAVEERARVVAATEAELSHLETLIHEKKKELDFLKNRVDSCASEFKVEEMKLTQLRISLDECMVEQRSKTSLLDQLLESVSKTQLDFELKGQKLVLMENDLERYRAQVSAEMEHLGRTQDRRTELEEDMKRKSKDLTLIMDQIAKCEKLLKTRSSELGTSQGELELKGKLLQQINIDLERRRGEVSAEDERWRTTQDHRRVFEEEMMKKEEELKAVCGRIADYGKQLELLENQLDSQKKLLESMSSELDFKGKELERLREAERSSSMDLDLREHLLKDTCQQLESKSKELEDIKGLIEERSAHYESIKMLIEEHAEELASKEKKQNEITEAIHKLSLEISSKEKTLGRTKVFIEQLSEKQQSKEKELDSTKKRLERCIADYNSKTKEIRSVKDKLGECLQNLEDKEDKLKSLQSLITERNKQVDEGEKKMHHLDNSNKELLRELQLKKEEVCSINNAIKKCSGELESKRRQYDQVQTSVTDLSAKLKSKECDLLSVKKKIQDSLKDFLSKEEQQARLEASLMEREQKLALKATQFDALSEKIEQRKKDLDAQERRIDEKGQELAKCVKDYEQKAKILSSFLQQGKPDQPVNLLRDANVCDKKTLQLLLQGHLKKCPQLYQDVSSALKTSSDPGKLALDTIQKLYSAHQRMTISDPNPNGVRRSIICLLDCLMDISPKPRKEVQGEAMKFAIEWKNTALVKAENPVEVLCFLHFLAAFSLAYTLDADKVHSLFDDVFLRKYAPSLCEALGVSALAPGTDEQQQSEAPSNNSLSPDVQEMTTVSQLANEDVLRDHDVSASLSPNEVCTELPLFEDPGNFVLNSVKDALTGARQRGEMSLGEPIVKALLPFLEEVTRVVSSIDPDLWLDAAKVAQQWSKMMGTSGQLLPLEALGFLQFIVAYGLVDRTRPNETLPFASYVTHFKQAPKLFHSLGLNNAIPGLVKQLLEARRYIPAVRFMVYFNMNINCTPLLFLKEEINNLRRSIKENRRLESQAEDRDAGKLREIIEVIEDLKLEMDLPVDVIVKFMVPRKTPNQSQCVVLSSAPPVQPPQIFPPPVHMQASHTVIHRSYISNPTSVGVSRNEHVLDVETYQAVGSTAFKGQSSHQTGIKRSREDSRCSRSAIRPCFNPPGK